MTDGNDVQAHTVGILLRQVGTAINRILESGEAVSRVKALVAAGEHSELAGTQALSDYAMFAEPFRRFGASCATRGYAYKSIEQEVEAVDAKLLHRFGPSWTNMTGDRDLLIYLLALPVHEALWEAQKIIAESAAIRPSDAKEDKAAKQSLKKLRKEVGLSQGALASIVEIDVGTLGRIERGTQKPSPYNAHAIANALTVRLGRPVHPDDLLLE